MPKKIYIVDLTKEERTFLLDFIKRDKKFAFRFVVRKWDQSSLNAPLRNTRYSPEVEPMGLAVEERIINPHSLLISEEPPTG